jgi:hypothetical protein
MLYLSCLYLQPWWLTLLAHLNLIAKISIFCSGCGTGVLLTVLAAKIAWSAYCVLVMPLAQWWQEREERRDAQVCEGGVTNGRSTWVCMYQRGMLWNLTDLAWVCLAATSTRHCGNAFITFAALAALAMQPCCASVLLCYAAQGP